MKSKHHVMKIPSIHMKKIYYEGNAKLCLNSNDNPSSLRESARTGSSLSPEHSKKKSIILIVRMKKGRVYNFQIKQNT